MVKTRPIDDPALSRNQVKIHAVDGLGIGYSSVFVVFGGRLLELRDKRRASNGKLFFSQEVCHAMLGTARSALFRKRSG